MSSGDCPTLARFCFFHSSKERKFALSSGDSESSSASARVGVAGSSCVEAVEDDVTSAEARLSSCEIGTSSVTVPAVGRIVWVNVMMVTSEDVEPDVGEAESFPIDVLDGTDS